LILLIDYFLNQMLDGKRTQLTITFFPFTTSWTITITI